MATPPISDELLSQAVEAFQRLGSKTAAAVELGLPRNTFCSRLNRAAERGLLGTEPVLPGFAIKSVASKVGDAWVKQTKEHGAPFEVPQGHTTKGVSALVDAEGRTIQQWIKTSREQESRDALELAIHEAFDRHAGTAWRLPEPTSVHADLLTIYPIVDLHLGLYAWGRETGADYDTEIASGLLRQSVANLVARSAASQVAIILDMGDYYHADDSRNQTKRSGNPLDVDTRYARVLQIGVELTVECIELALQKHQHVIYRKLPGNHDDETSLMLAIALAAWFRNEPRVTVDTDPGRFFKHTHGKVMIAATHGDMLRMGDMAGFMAANWPRDWGATEFRYAYTGHVHHDRVKSGGGVRAESFNTLAAKDAWHAASGYVSARSAVSITMHKDMGEIDRLTVNLPRGGFGSTPVAANDNQPMARAA
ncbi:hypothetical protein QBK99_12630 [Corticibacterium sp. UT-5YL-CI-8]|nr:hypothetical protein [Tianweitania sp. UT-5YL-CI-8]